jgi:hypothetical protein
VITRPEIGGMIRLKRGRGVALILEEKGLGHLTRFIERAQLYRPQFYEYEKIQLLNELADPYAYSTYFEF